MPIAVRKQAARLEAALDTSSKIATRLDRLSAEHWSRDPDYFDAEEAIEVLDELDSCGRILANIRAYLYLAIAKDVTLD